ncbi:hypothetical protein NASMSEV_060 [Candidatus Nasuia deltocephalinicola]|uniref:Uncharacterized protein n=1 Tax=Candidatus Nasuia deltocephalincola TaxID=1160784 RepID=A0A7G6UHM9_9PROT|nr:hypothetical protein NASMSEV_060 [Candidatus Nasuia deltocephalinicola]
MINEKEIKYIENIKKSKLYEDCRLRGVYIVHPDEKLLNGKKKLKIKEIFDRNNKNNEKNPILGKIKLLEKKREGNIQ